MSPDLHHLSGAYAVDALEQPERESFEHHLAFCPDCRAEVAELSQTATQLSVLSEATPPPALRDAVLSGITRVRPLPPLVKDSATVTSVSSAPAAVGTSTTPADAGSTVSDVGGGSDATVIPMRRRVSTWFAAAAAAVAIAAGGVAWGPWTSDPASPMDQVVSASDATRVTSSKGALTAEVAYSRQLGKGAITVNGLPPAPDGKTYQLWYVGADGIARSAGLMEADSDGRGTRVLEGNPNDAAAVGMTVEPAGGSQAPTTDPLVVLALA